MCVMGDYDLCGVNSLPIYHIWGGGVLKCHGEMETFFYGTNCYQKWGGKKKLKFVYKSIDSSELLEYMKPKLQFFVHHNFVARWQDMIKYCLENFPNDVVVSVVDFTRNYSFEIQNKMQSMHWYKNYVTIWFTFLGSGTHALILMRKLPKPSWDTTFTFLMTRAMIIILCNIIYSCIGTIWWQVGLGQINTKYGLMVVIRNSKVKYQVVLC